jgi:hypothetical protein
MRFFKMTKVMTAAELAPLMRVPPRARDALVRVTVVPVKDVAETAKTKTNATLLKKLKGSLSQYANPNLRNLEKKAFEMAIEENREKGRYDVKKDN